MRKHLVGVTAAVAVALAIAPGALAGGSAHFIKSATSASLSGQNLVCQFKEAGLSSGSTETVSCDANELVTYECVNGGGKNPSASNKRAISSSASRSGSFPVDQNGNLTGSLTLAPKSAADLGFSCPGGQTVTLVSVSYSDVQVVDQTSGASASLPGAFTYTNPNAPK
jgi:hypothetical protein